MDKKNIESIYPLAPLQQAFLWNSLQYSSQAGLLHVRCRLHGELDLIQLQQAWSFVVKRHPALRTSVHWESIKQPLQVVAQRIMLPWELLDWCNQKQPEAALSNWLQADRDRGFDLTQAPIMRLTLIRFSETEYELVWSCHHLMLDGWSGAMVLNQVFECYEDLLQGQPAPVGTVPSYQSYIQWINKQDEKAAATFWKETLTGFTTPTPLPTQVQREISSPEISPLSVTLSPESTHTLNALLRSQQITLSTMIQGVWALLLSFYSGEVDVVFGLTVSGRQCDLDSVENIIGLLINILPMRFRLSYPQPVITWLQTLQIQQVNFNRYAYASTAQIQDWSGLSARLFDSLLVIENYPMYSPKFSRRLKVDNIQSGIVSNYGITILVKPGESLKLLACAEAQYFDKEGLKTLLDQFQFMLLSVVENPERSIGELHETLKLQQLAEKKSRTVLVRTHPPSIPKKHLVFKDFPTFSGQYQESQQSYTSTHHELEYQLTKIWEEVLNIPSISIEDNFFDLGGHSLLAVKLFSQVEKRFGKSLPLALLFQAPTIKKLASLLHDSGWSPNWSSLVPIQPYGSKPPFFCVHPGGGNVLYYSDLAKHLGLDQPFYGFQAQGLDGISEPYTKIEDMASHYIQDMQKIQPEGPYLLGGFCLGGTIAFEMAYQLQLQGKEVALLALMDPQYSLVQLDLKGPPIPSSGKKFRYYLLNSIFIWRMKGLKIVVYLISKILGIKVNKIFQEILNFLGIKACETQALANEESQDLQRLIEANKIALDAYKLRFYAGKTTFLQTREYASYRIGSFVKEKYSEFSEEIEWHIVPTSHLSVFRPARSVKVWSNTIEHYLHKVQNDLNSCQKS